MIPYPRIFLTLWVVFSFFLDPMLEISTVKYLYLSRAIAEDGSFVVDRFAHPSRGDLAERDGHLYSGTLPGIGFMLVPHAFIAAELAPLLGLRVNLVLQILAIVFFNAPAAALAAVLLIRTLADLGIDWRRSVLIGIAAALGTPLFFFTSKLSDYPIIILMQILIVRSPSRTHACGMVLTGIALGICALVNNLAVFLMTFWILFTTPFFPLSGFCKRWGMIILGALPALVARAWYLAVCFGSPAADPLAHSAARISILDIYEALGSRSSLFAAMMREIPDVAWGLTFGEVGVFLFAPFFLLFFAYRRGLPTLAKAGAAIVLINAFAHIALIGGVWKGGASWGPRYMLFSLVPAMIALGFIARNISIKKIATLTAVSVLVSLIGVMYGYNTNIFSALGLFLLGGPTTPSFRFLWLHWPITPSPERVALVLEETPRIGAYYAFTHPAPFAAGLVLILLLLLIWRQPIREYLNRMART